MIEVIAPSRYPIDYVKRTCSDMGEVEGLPGNHELTAYIHPGAKDRHSKAQAIADEVNRRFSERGIPERTTDIQMSDEYARITIKPFKR